METTMKKLYFSPEIAEYLGRLDEAVFLHNICYWVEINRIKENNEEEGLYWTYNSDTSFTEIFPYFTVSVIRRIRRNLLKAGLIKVGRFNRWKQDKTTWYTYTNKVLGIVHPEYINSIKNSTEQVLNPYD
jgi:hypothetical protein